MDEVCTPDLGLIIDLGGGLLHRRCMLFSWLLVLAVHQQAACVVF